jgi:hypothetical protein
MNDFQPHPVDFPVLNRVWNAKLGRPATRMAALVGVMMGLLSTAPAIAVGFPAIPAKDSRDDYRRCIAQLTQLKLSPEDSLAACGQALTPEYVATCTMKVSSRGYEPAIALAACRQVKRPEDMAHCVVDIRNDLKALDATSVLDNCRRSLLPIRYSDCVIGMSRASAAIAPTALSTCIDTQYLPREVDATFIPYGATPTAPTVPEVAPPQRPTPTPAPVRGLY